MPDKPNASTGAAIESSVALSGEFSGKAEIVQHEGYMTLYANYAASTITRWDFAFNFGQIQKRPNKFEVVQMLGLYMSPQHAKSFSALLAKQIKLYEDKFGAIPEQGAEE